LSLKRKKPLKSKKNLEPKTPMLQKKPLDSKSVLQSNKELKQRSKKNIQMYSERIKLVKRLFEERKKCEARWDDNCTKTPDDVHELKNRSLGGKIVGDDDSEYLVVCRYCHTMITDNPAEAHERGLRKWSWE
jgi:hypothetical protein